MKAILFSSDFQNVEAISTLERMVGKPAGQIKFAVLNEAAAVEFGDNSFFVDGMHFLKHHFGGFELVNLLALDSTKIHERLEACDAIFCFGGSSDYLMQVLEKTGTADILAKLLHDKVWCGSSAGSMVFGYRPSEKIAQDLWGGTEREETNSWEIKKYLEFAPLCILPHLYGGNLTQDPRDATVIENSATMSVPVFALSDWAAVAVDGEKVELLGKKWTKLENGKIIAKG